jgi:hypothetical protein
MLYNYFISSLCSNALASLAFVQSGRYINPSRIDPQGLRMYSPTPSSSRHRLRVLGGMAICVSSMFSVESFLTVCCERGRPEKHISGIFHNQEWQRFESLMCLLCGQTTLRAQFVNNALSFSTRAKDPGVFHIDHNPCEVVYPVFSKYRGLSFFGQTSRCSWTDWESTSRKIQDCDVIFSKQTSLYSWHNRLG